MCDLDAPSPRQVAVEVELLFQLQGLIPRVRRPLSLRFTVRVYSTLTNMNPLHPGIDLRRISST